MKKLLLLMLTVTSGVAFALVDPQYNIQVLNNTHQDIVSMMPPAWKSSVIVINKKSGPKILK